MRDPTSAEPRRAPGRLRSAAALAGFGALAFGAARVGAPYLGSAAFGAALNADLVRRNLRFASRPAAHALRR